VGLTVALIDQREDVVKSLSSDLKASYLDSSGILLGPRSTLQKIGTDEGSGNSLTCPTAISTASNPVTSLSTIQTGWRCSLRARYLYVANHQL